MLWLNFIASSSFVLRLSVHGSVNSILQPENDEYFHINFGEEKLFAFIS